MSKRSDQEAANQQRIRERFDETVASHADQGYVNGSGIMLACTFCGCIVVNFTVHTTVCPGRSS